MIVFFGGKSSSDWGLKLYDFQISPPEPQTVYVDVPFRDGTLDFSTALTISTVSAWVLWLGCFAVAALMVRKSSRKKSRRVV